VWSFQVFLLSHGAIAMGMNHDGMPAKGKLDLSGRVGLPPQWRRPAPDGSMQRGLVDCPGFLLIIKGFVKVLVCRTGNLRA
jgi:hypothetical protein